VHHDRIGEVLGEPVDGLLSPVGRAVVDHSEHGARGCVRRLDQDLGDQRGERFDPGRGLAAAVDLGRVDVVGGQAGQRGCNQVIWPHRLQINRSYAELAVHYGTLVDPARAFKPKDKRRVERPMPYVRDSYWRGRAFTSLQEMQSGAVRWSRDVAGTWSSRVLDGAAPAAVFGAGEAPALGPMPTTPFVLATWSNGKVGPDIHVKVQRLGLVLVQPGQAQVDRGSRSM
jgi:hypothetical protein